MMELMALKWNNKKSLCNYKLLGVCKLLRYHIVLVFLFLLYFLILTILMIYLTYILVVNGDYNLYLNSMNRRC